MTYLELQAALQVFGLGERAALKQIKARHRELVKQHHPDTGTKQAPEPEHIQRVNAAYKTLLAYIDSFHFLFSEEEFYRQNPEARVREQFRDDPLWGKG